MGFIEQLLRIIAPHYCVGCGAEGRLLCSACVAGLPGAPLCCYRCGRASADFRPCAACRPATPLFCVIPVTPYDGLAKKVIHRLKFERSRAAAADIAEALVARLPLSGVAADIVTYVPTASARVRTRGYDQAQLIARAVAQRAGLPYAALLARRSSVRQLGQDRATRQRQIQDVFYPVRAEAARGRHILLIDDVLTTGATCEAAAAQLTQAGATRVSGAVFAVA